MAEEIGEEKKIKYCPNCGEKIDEKAEICPKCGVRVKEAPIQPTAQKSAGLAVVFSFFIPGLGQIYNGQIGKGILFIIVGAILALTIFVLVGFILYPIFWIYNLYDAYSTAEKINAGKISA
jgi:TM2 domain-containing membrane protein YozV